MALGTRTQFTTTSATVAVPSGSNRIAELKVSWEQLFSDSPTITATLDGVSMVSSGTLERTSAGSGNDVFSASFHLLEASLPTAGNYTAAFSISPVGSQGRLASFAVHTDRAQEAPQYIGADLVSGTPLTIGPLNTVNDAYGTASLINGGGGRTATVGGSWTERFDGAGSGSDTSGAIADITYSATGTDSVSWTPSTNNRVAGVFTVFNPAVAGPTITVQPANDVGIISNGQSTVYTATATGTNVQAPTWSEDGTPISDGGIYDIVTTGAGTSSCSSTLTITRTVKTGTPFDIKANFADDNGDTDTNTVTDTWWTGPSVTTFPATDGDGESTATLTSDYVTGVGEAIEVRIPLSDGDVAVTVTTT